MGDLPVRHVVAIPFHAVPVERVRPLCRQNGWEQLVGFVLFEFGRRLLVQGAAIFFADRALDGIAGRSAIREVSVDANAGLAQRAV